MHMTLCTTRDLPIFTSKQQKHYAVFLSRAAAIRVRCPAACNLLGDENSTAVALVAVSPDMCLLKCKQALVLVFGATCGKGRSTENAVTDSA